MDEWYVIIATGPSRTNDDTRALRDVGRVVAVNCGVFYAPWAYALFAGDSVWWRYYGPMIDWYKGRRISRTHRGNGIEVWRGRGWKRSGGNSGHMAIQWAVDDGAKNIALLGFDQQKTNGRAHCHVDHPKAARDGSNTNLANAAGVVAWPRMMTRTSLDLRDKGINVVNLSRETALRCFPRMSVEHFLENRSCQSA